MIFVSLALAASVPPIEQTAWWGCLTNGITKLERSGEKPRDIATAALDMCHSSEPELGPQLMMRIRAKVADRLVARVVEIRAAR